MRVLGIVPARGGSKGVPRKSIRMLAGMPLLCYTAAAALAARRLSRVVLSTDDTEIADVGRRAGLDVPFLRPAELADDSAPMLGVVRHAIEAVEAVDPVRWDAVCLLQPTVPFRDPDEIDACVDLLDATGADCAVTVRSIPAEHHPFWAYVEGPDRTIRLFTGDAEPRTRRQDLPRAFHRDGSVYVSRRDVVMHRNSLYGARVVGLPMEGEMRVNIDTMADWERAERLVRDGAAPVPLPGSCGPGVG